MQKVIFGVRQGLRRGVF